MQKRIINSIIDNIDFYSPKVISYWFIGPLRFDANMGSTPYFPVTRGSDFMTNMGYNRKQGRYNPVGTHLVPKTSPRQRFQDDVKIVDSEDVHKT